MRLAVSKVEETTGRLLDRPPDGGGASKEVGGATQMWSQGEEDMVKRGESGQPGYNLFSLISVFDLISHFHCILPQNPLGDFSELCWTGQSPPRLRGSQLWRPFL